MTGMLEFTSFSKMNSRRWCVLLFLLITIITRVKSNRISILVSTPSKVGRAENSNNNSKGDLIDDTVHTISDGEESIAGLDREFIDSERQKSPANETDEAAQGARSVNDTVEVTMTMHNDIAPEQKLDAGDASPCGRYKACTMDDWAAIRIEKLKRTILKKLNLDHPPNVTAVPRNSPPVLEMMRRHGIQRQPPDTDVFDDEEIVTKDVVAVARPPPINLDIQEPCCYFHIVDDTAGFAVQSAFLWIYVNGSVASGDEVLVEINRFHPSPHPEVPARLTIVKIVQLRFLSSSLKTGWKRINVTGLVQGWVKRPNSNYGIKVHALRYPGLVVMPNGRDGNAYQPFVDMKLTMLPHRRKRNSVRTCDSRGNADPRCCLYNLEVDFEAIGWDWIIYPSKFNARLCSGECTMMQMESLRSKVLHHADLARGRISSCCVPKKMASISMLYHDNSENIVYSRVPEMAITSCDCL